MRYSEIEKKLGYTFQNKDLLRLAFVHRSYFNENRDQVSGHNERLEFLGDAVLGLIISKYLYTHLPTHSEGHLSHLRAHLVGAESCSRYMRQLNLEGFLLLGKGETINVGKGRERILADLFEAVVGAIFLDGGLEAVQAFILLQFKEQIGHALAEPLRNWKAELQDYIQKKYQKYPDYQLLEESGPAHNKLFQVVVEIEGIGQGRGEGSSKKQAEVAAAEDALRMIEKQKEMERGES